MDVSGVQCFFPFVAWSPDRDVLDSPYDALSSSFKFVCLKARKFRNSFLCRSSKPFRRSGASESTGVVIGLNKLLVWGFFFFGMLVLCLSVCPSAEALLLFIQNFIHGDAPNLSVRSPLQIFLLDFRCCNLVKYRFQKRKKKKKVNSLCLRFYYEAY